MTEETAQPYPAVTLDIAEDELLNGELIVWRGTQDTPNEAGRVDFEVFALAVGIHEGRQLARRGERLITGTMDSTGCADIDLGTLHLCQFAEWQRVMRMLGHIYVRAFDLMGCEPSKATDPQGHAVLQAAKRAREADRVQSLIDKAVADIQSGGIASIPTKA